MVRQPVEWELLAIDKSQPGFRSAKQSATQLDQQLQKLNVNFRRVVQVVTGGLIARAIRGVVSAQAELATLAKQVNATTEEISQLQIAFVESGLGAQKLADVMGKLEAQRQLALRSPGGVQAQGFAQLGINLIELQQLRAPQLLDEMAKGLQDFGDAAQEIETLALIFPERFRDFVTILQGGPDALREWRDEADRLGITLRAVDAAKFERFDADLQQLTLVFKTFVRELTLTVLPAIEQVVDWLKTFLQFLRDALAYLRPFTEAMARAFSVGNAPQPTLQFADMDRRFGEAAQRQLERRQRLEGLLPLPTVGEPDLQGPQPDWEQVNTNLREQQGLLGGLREGWAALAQSQFDFVGRVSQGVVELAGTIENQLVGAIMAGAEGTKSWSDAFRDAGKSILKTLAEITLRLAIVKALQGAGLGPLGTFALHGGIYGGSGHRGPLFELHHEAPRRYLHGGIADRRSMVIYGEGSRSEAIVPLADGRTIPVALRGGRQPVSVTNVYISAMDSQDVARALAKAPEAVLGVSQYGFTHSRIYSQVARDGVRR